MRRAQTEYVAQSLRDFWERQRFRAAQRQLRSDAYYASQFPIHMVKRRILNLERDIYPSGRSPEAYTRFQRVKFGAAR